jgi:molybdopterin converting factor small subunit
MISLYLKVVGSLKLDLVPADRKIEMPDGAVVKDLIQHLKGMGLELGTAKYVVVLNGLGLNQWLPDQPLKTDDTLMVIPPLMGG